MLNPTLRKFLLALSMVGNAVGMPIEREAMLPSEISRLGDQLVHARAVEAVLWGMPALSDIYFREAVYRDWGLQPGEVAIIERLAQAHHEVLTANNQTSYAVMGYDLKLSGPLVVDVPASDEDYLLIGQLCDNWQASTAMIGATGPDDGKGGKYLLLPPDFSGAVPAGYFPVKVSGYRGVMVMRPVFSGQGTLAGALALAKRMQVYPLADAAHPRPTRFFDVSDKPLKSLPEYDIGSFKRLARFIDEEPLLERDKVMIGMLATLGIEKGKPFRPDAHTRAILERAVKDAWKLMQQGFNIPGKALVARWPQHKWLVPNKDVLRKLGNPPWSFDTGSAVWAYERATTPFFWANYLPSKLGAEQFYLMAMQAGDGRRFSGKRSYRLRVPADVPAERFWSAILYSQRTKSFIPNPLQQFGIDSYRKDTLKRNADGSVDVYLGAKAPKGMESNWLPSAGEDFFLIFRIYGPKKPVFDLTWALNDVEEIRLK